MTMLADGGLSAFDPFDRVRYPEAVFTLFAAERSATQRENPRAIYPDLSKTSRRYVMMRQSMGTTV